MALKTNLVSYWTLDESSGGSGAVSRADSHGLNPLNDNNTTASATGIISNGADFESSNSEYLSIGGTIEVGLGITGDFSIQAWINPETITGGDKTIVAKWVTTTSNRSYRVGLTSTTSIRVDTSTNGVASTEGTVTTSTINTGSWYHVVVSKTGTSATVYLNGTSQGSATVNSSQYNGAGAFTIGAIGNPTNYFDGIIDEVAIWSRAITSTEVTELYNSGAGKAYSTWDTGGGTTAPVQSNLSLLGVS